MLAMTVRQPSPRSPRAGPTAATPTPLTEVAAGTTTGQGFTPPDLKALTELGRAEGQVNLVAWAGYVEDGTHRPGRRLGHGVRGGDRLPGQRQDRADLRRHGPPDQVRAVRRVSASGDASLRLIAAGDVEPVNTALVPNYADVFEA